jgi:hypothetical protein
MAVPHIRRFNMVVTEKDVGVDHQEIISKLGRLTATEPAIATLSTWDLYVSNPLIESQHMVM